MTDEYDAIRAQLRKLEQYQTRKLAEMATSQRVLCEYRDELEDKVDILLTMLAETESYTEVSAEQEMAGRYAERWAARQSKAASR